MDLNEKREKLSEIKQDFERNMGQNSRIENIGTMFFLYYPGACVLRDAVYCVSKRNKLEFEALSMTSSYFIGSKAHAEALQEALGGKCYPTEYCYLAEGARELYAWEGPKRQEQCEEIHRRGYTSQPLDIEEIKMILF